MNIQECKGQLVKLGKTSITVKNRETGKTCGIVRNVIKFSDLQYNKAAEYYKILKVAGMCGNNVVDLNCVVVADNELFYLFNTKSLNIQKEIEPDIHKKKIEMIERAKQYLNVIEVEF